MFALIDDSNPENPLTQKTCHDFLYPSWFNGFIDLDKRLETSHNFQHIRNEYLNDLGIAIKYIIAFLAEQELNKPQKGDK